MSGTPPRQGSLPTGSNTMSPAMQTAANYYAWIAEQFQPVLGSRVLDIGGGHGAQLNHVVAPGRFVASLDVDADCVQEMRSRFAGAAFEALCGDLTDSDVIARLAAQRFDTILCLNVLEHIDHDEAALASMRRILLPTGGCVFLLVPAHPTLYGTPDALAGHFRRYRRPELHRLLQAAGFHDVHTRYFNGFGAIPYFLNARVFKPRTLSGSVDTQIVLFDRYFVPVLRRVERWLRMPFGQSLIATAHAGGPR